jgi:hypothetical protein
LQFPFLQSVPYFTVSVLGVTPADHHWQSSAGRIRVKAELLSFPSESSAPGANGENDEKTSKCGASQQLDGPDSESYAVKDSENANWC